MGANKPATSAIFVLKSIAPMGRSYGKLIEVRPDRLCLDKAASR
jgi:hypothetical protein